MGNRIISISRQFGSGGHEIAVKTAGRLGLKVYERELVRQIGRASCRERV